MRLCPEPRCPNPSAGRSGPCTEHRRTRERARGTRQHRGYNATHDRERARWQARMDAGETVYCHNPRCRTPAVPVNPRSFDLGHTTDRTGHRGPEHPECNRSEGGKAAHR